MSLRDAHGRPISDLRVSVTDRCNLRCLYCMPEEEYTWLPRAELLTFEELARLVDVFTSVGIRQVRLTGGTTAEKQIELALFLASEQSNHISGRLIHVQDDWKKLRDGSLKADQFMLRRVQKI